MANEVGESVASINARADNSVCPRVLEALQSGATLFRPAKLTRYYTKCQNDHDPNEGIGISATMVKQLEKAGTIIRVGVDQYGIGKLPAPASTAQSEIFEIQDLLPSRRHSVVN